MCYPFSTLWRLQCLCRQYLHWPARPRAANSVTVPPLSCQSKSSFKEIEDSERVHPAWALSHFSQGPGVLGLALGSQQWWGTSSVPTGPELVNMWASDTQRELPANSGLQRRHDKWQEKMATSSWIFKQVNTLWPLFPAFQLNHKRVAGRKREPHPTSTPGPSHLCWLGDEQSLKCLWGSSVKKKKMNFGTF